MTARSEAAAVRAAGALLWRPSRKHGVRIALVRRPRYGDWSLPKGKADPGESPQLTAAREVEEETGFRAVLGRSLTTVTYAVAGGAKTVRYFAARAAAGKFVPNKEVDRLSWLSPTAAREAMSYDFDRAVLDTFLLEPPELGTVVLVRHARAGHRESFQGNDSLRPLDTKGRRQADALVGEILVFGPQSVHAAPLERCRATVTPLAKRLATTVLAEKELAEEAYRDDPAGARHKVIELALASVQRPDGRTGNAGQIGSGCVVACSQGGVIPGVVKSLANRYDVAVPQVGTPKASFWVLSFDGRRLVQADPYPAPAV